jgi:hypothetical protein
MANNSKSTSTISGHQGPWVPFGQANVYDKIWSGKKVPPDAWRVLFWLTNRMTGTVKLDDDPRIYGVVAGGHPVSLKDIASAPMLLALCPAFKSVARGQGNDHPWSFR